MQVSCPHDVTELFWRHLQICNRFWYVKFIIYSFYSQKKKQQQQKNHFNYVKCLANYLESIVICLIYKPTCIHFDSSCQSKSISASKSSVWNTVWSLDSTLPWHGVKALWVSIERQVEQSPVVQLSPTLRVCSVSSVKWTLHACRKSIMSPTSLTTVPFGSFRSSSGFPSQQPGRLGRQLFWCCWCIQVSLLLRQWAIES